MKITTYKSRNLFKIYRTEWTRLPYRVKKMAILFMGLRIEFDYEHTLIK